MADGAIEVVRKELVLNGMRPHRQGKLQRKKVEIISYPWVAGKEIFVLVREPNRPETVQCVGADEIRVV